jgi:non-canonical poly(A) RNA polymerase PAPD5/7
MSGELKAFGSYAAGLYLPTADMDLVFLTRNFRPGRVSMQDETRRLLNIFTSFLKQRNIAKPGSLAAIKFAKVPIIKFIDRISGLKIDLSFDNDSGVAAIETFQNWKEEYPMMPIIVSIVKHYLMIRGLNDVSTGGLGGFSIICLVTSLLQHLPPTGKPRNLGEVLIEFFNLYGNVFDKDSVVIRLEPPAYLDKAAYMPHVFDDRDGRLTIIDPNRPDNNISGGTRSINDIIRCFSSAHQALIQQLAAAETRRPQDQPPSFLACLVGGSFQQYEAQRQALHNLSNPIPKSKPIATKASMQSAAKKHGLPARPPATTSKDNTLSGASRATSTKVEDDESESSHEDAQVSTKPPTKAQKRAKRFKMLRPDLAHSISDTISVASAVRIGGYKTAESMLKDLEMRELNMLKRAATTTQ